MSDEILLKLDQLAKQQYDRNGKLPVIERDTDPWRQWLEWRQQHGLKTDFMRTQPRWTVPTEYPPADFGVIKRSAADAVAA